MYFDPETYDERINNLLVEIRKQNQQLQREEAWLNSQNKNHILTPKKKKHKSKSQVRKEQLQKQIPNLKNINKFFNFY